MAVDIIPTSTDGTDLRIGIVVSRFNEYAGRGDSRPAWMNFASSA